jgi:hypothetical protein
MARRVILIFILFLLAAKVNTFAQDNDVQVGTVPRNPSQMFGLFDYSDPTKVNIKVSIWGYVKYPGKYIVPVNSTLRDLLSIAGGPTADAYLDDVRLVRTLADSTQQVFTYNFSELILEPSITKKVPNQTLQPGDMLFMPGQPRMYFKDYFSLFLSTVSALSSLTILVINLTK